MRARVIEAGPAVRPYRAPAVVDRAPATVRKIAALRVPPLPRPAPERLTQTVSITPSAEPEAPVEIAAVPNLPAIAEAVTVAPTVATKPARPVSTMPVTALQGEWFDPADTRDPITVY